MLTNKSWKYDCHKFPHTYLINAWSPLLFLWGSIQPPKRRKPASPFTGRSGHGLCPSPHSRLPCASRHLSMPHGFKIKGCSIPLHLCLHNLANIRLCCGKESKYYGNNIYSQQGQHWCCHFLLTAIYLTSSNIKHQNAQHHLPHLLVLNWRYSEAA